jgi:ParB-like chromosome segregation protein Spo0J
MDPATFDALVADIAKNGLREPIIVDQLGRIVDGRNRFNACLKLEMSPRIERRSFTDGEALRFSASRNLHRRHLTIGQRSSIAAEIATRMRGGMQPAKSPDAMSQADAARLMGVSERAVRSAARLLRNAPDLHQQVKDDALSLHAAEKRLCARVANAADIKREPLPQIPARKQPSLAAGAAARAAVREAAASDFIEHLARRLGLSIDLDDPEPALFAAVERVITHLLSLQRIQGETCCAE